MANPEWKRVEAHMNRVFRTRDGGDSWVNTGSDAIRSESQPNYTSVVAIHPQPCRATVHNRHLGHARWYQR